ncbi:hypothetical protein ACFE04_020586 [Oxalis oulophora]
MITLVDMIVICKLMLIKDFRVVCLAAHLVVPNKVLLVTARHLLGEGGGGDSFEDYIEPLKVYLASGQIVAGVDDDRGFSMMYVGVGIEMRLEIGLGLNCV